MSSHCAVCTAPKIAQLIFELRYLVADGLRSKILRQSCMSSGAEPNKIMDTDNVISPSTTSLSHLTNSVLYSKQ